MCNRYFAGSSGSAVCLRLESGGAPPANCQEFLTIPGTTTQIPVGPQLTAFTCECARGLLA
jgi:hypothetical protein